ncbi:quinoprotein relay system zinc metallohydrolase 1 [Paracoccus siganidrum]|nr:quinoprotein relay system zinc metallohydrolase 1 [Paracoccus siganidrum]
MTGLRPTPRPTRRGVLAAGAAALALRPAVALSPADPASPVEVADGVWMIEGAAQSFARTNGGAICNIVLLATPEGAVVVDTGSNARQGAALRQLADQKFGGVAAVVNTHHHPDHWLGNQAFADRPILALPQSRALQAENGQGYSDNLYRILGSWMNGTAFMPATADAAPGPLVIGGRALRLIAMSGHSQADLLLLDQATGTLVAGDMLFLDRAPSFPDAAIADWLAGLDRIAAIGAGGVVPGHGPFHRSSAALAQTRAYLRAFAGRMARASGLGLAPAEAIHAGPMPEFASLGANPEEYRRAVVQRWRDFESDALPVIGGT